MAERGARRRRRTEPARGGDVAQPVVQGSFCVGIAQVSRPHGLQGELRLQLYNPDSDLIERLQHVELVLGDGRVSRATIRSVRRSAGAALLAIEGVEDRTAAEELRGAELRVPREALGQADDDEYFVCDLERCQVLLQGEPLGSVERVMAYPTCDVLVVRRPDGSHLEVPLHEDFVAEVRIEQRIVALRSIEGLE